MWERRPRRELLAYGLEFVEGYKVFFAAGRPSHSVMCSPNAAILPSRINTSEKLRKIRFAPLHERGNRFHGFRM